MPHWLQLLQSRICGQVRWDASTVQTASSNFGRILQKQPLAVVRPRTAADVAETIRFGREQGLKITSRGLAHSQDAHGLNEDGILLDLTSLEGALIINPEDLWFEAPAGMQWKDVVEALKPYRLLPPILTNNLGTTVGGTCSVAGLGVSSFRYGTQADQCLAIEVVTGTGEILWCTPDENTELFYHALCGLGQFGIITRVRHRLRPHKPLARTYYLLYDSLEQLMSDCSRLMEADRPDYLECWASPANQGLRTFASGRRLPFAAWFYPMHLTVEFDPETPPREEQVLEGLSPYRHVHTEDLSIHDFVFRLEPVFALWKATGYWDNTHPWMEAILPWPAAPFYIQTVLQELSPVMLGGGHVLIWPAQRNRTRMPMFQIPEGECVLGFGILAGVPAANLPLALPQLHMASDAAMMMDAKRYMSGWLNFDADRWRKHFGDYWPTVCALKHKYDPAGILNPGLIVYDPPGSGEE